MPTPKQTSFLYTLIQKKGQPAYNELCRMATNEVRDPEDLSVKQASWIIDGLLDEDDAKPAQKSVKPVKVTLTKMTDEPYVYDGPGKKLGYIELQNRRAYKEKLTEYYDQRRSDFHRMLNLLRGKK